MSEDFDLEVKPRMGKDENVYGVYARRNGRLVGHACGQINPDKTAVLENINVDACERHKGVGTALLVRFAQCMREEGITKITGEMKTEYGLNVDETKNFYEKNGFEVGRDYTFSRRL